MRDTSTVEHRTFTVERDYPHPPSLVFSAWADPAVKVGWFDLSDARDPDWHSDFRVGGDEYWHAPAEATPRADYDATYCDIVPNHRIVMTVRMSVDGRLSSVSLATIELTPTPDGTRLRYTDQGAFLDGREDPAARGSGAGSQLDRLGTYLAGVHGTTHP